MIACDRCPEKRTAHVTIEIEGATGVGGHMVSAMQDDFPRVLNLCRTCYEPLAKVLTFYVEDGAKVGWDQRTQRPDDGAEIHEMTLVQMTTAADQVRAR